MKYDRISTKCLALLTGCMCTGILGGCATTTATDPRDPWEGMNRHTQAFNDSLDEYILEPVAKGYDWVMPTFASTGVSNFFSNLRDIKVTINDFLQGKFTQGSMDAGRFLVNTTAGVAGFVDVATMIDLPKHDEDFGQTLGYWGVPSGPYLVIPFWGPSTIRGLTGRVGDAAMNPLTYTFFLSDTFAASAASFGAYMVDVVDRRAEVLGLEKVAEEAADPYEFYRDSYLQMRDSLINDGEVPDVDDEFGYEYDEDVELPPEAE